MNAAVDHLAQQFTSWSRAAEYGKKHSLVAPWKIVGPTPGSYGMPVWRWDTKGAPADSNVVELAAHKKSAPPADPPVTEAFPEDLRPWRIQNPEEFASSHIPPVWQVYGYVPATGTGLDTGASGTLKSFKLLEVATCINRGTPYAGRATTKGVSVIVVAEGTFGYPARMHALAKHLRCDLKELPAILPVPVNLFQREPVDALIRELKLRGATFVVLDTKWRCSVGAEENSAKDSAVVFGAMERIAREAQCFITAISHTGLADGTRIRGSSSQFAAVDVEVLHTMEGDICTSKISKCKDAEAGAKWFCRAKKIDLPDNPHGSLVLEPADGTNAAASQRKKSLTGLPKLVHDTLSMMAPSGACAVDELIDAVNAKLPEDLTDTGRNRNREFVRRAISRALIPGEYAFMHPGDRIGLTNIVQQTDDKPDPFAIN